MLLGAVEHGPLGILRSLGRLRIAVYVCDSEPWSPSAFSRYCREAFRIPITDCASGELLSNLVRVARQIGRSAILLPTTDEMSVFVAEHRNELQRWFLFPSQDPALVRSMASKRSMHELAKRYGVPTADSYFPQSRAELVRFAARITYPAILKGINVMKLWRAVGKRMFVVHSPAELLEHYDSVPESEKCNLLLQEYIPGGDDTVWMFNGYFDRNSECLAGYTAKKLRQCPVNCGVASLAVSEANEVVGTEAKRLMALLGYHGAVDIDYKFDPRDGKYKILDVNPRIGASFRVCVSDNGMDVARALYLNLTGQPVVATSAIPGRKWVVEDLDSVSCLRYARRGMLNGGKWLRSYRGIQESAYFAPDDPLPLLPMFVIDARKAVSRTGRRLRRLLPSISRAPKLNERLHAFPPPVN